jgi:hypothetical protein
MFTAAHTAYKGLFLLWGNNIHCLQSHLQLIDLRTISGKKSCKFTAAAPEKFL